MKLRKFVYVVTHLTFFTDCGVEYACPVGSNDMRVFTNYTDAMQSIDKDSNETLRDVNDPTLTTYNVENYNDVCYSRQECNAVMIRYDYDYNGVHYAKCWRIDKKFLN